MLYFVYDGVVHIEKYTGTAPVVEIPAEICGKPVTQIYNKAFAPAKDFLTEVTIANSVKKISEAAFSDWEWQDGSTLQKKNKSIEIFTTKQFVRFDCTSLSNEEINALTDIMNGYGCPLYDSTISTRFGL